MLRSTYTAHNDMTARSVMTNRQAWEALLSLPPVPTRTVRKTWFQRLFNI